MRTRGAWCRVVAGMAFFLCVVAFGRADVADHLAGQWSMSDESAALVDPKNPVEFEVSRVVRGANDWSDGSFSLTWAGDTVASRGYYSLKTGRVWITTRRYIDGRSQQVEYRGALKGDDRVIWEGTAGTTNTSPRVVWSFVAERR